MKYYVRSSAPLVFNYEINGTNIERVSKFNDLGVIFDPRLSFVYSLRLARSRATVGLIKHLSPTFRNPKTLLTLFNSLVRSNLEYRSLLWSLLAS